ncbi:MAG: hypothetical protein M3463_06790 [Verrucomicrobiota bacterium]|nr:hypothetical protein [Verrucomicrobiota bacterium]
MAGNLADDPGAGDDGVVLAALAGRAAETDSAGFAAPAGKRCAASEAANGTPDFGA